MFTSGTQQTDGSYFPQQTRSTVQNDSGYDNFTARINNDPYYSQQVGNQQFHVHTNHPYDNSGLSSTKYQGIQQQHMMPVQNNGQHNSQDTPFQNQYGYQNDYFQYNGRPEVPQNHRINHGRFQQQFQQPHKFVHPQQMHDSLYGYQQHHLSNQASSYHGQGSYMPRGKTSCYILCNSNQQCVINLFIFTGFNVGKKYSRYLANDHVEQVIKN